MSKIGLSDFAVLVQNEKVEVKTDKLSKFSFVEESNAISDISAVYFGYHSFFGN